MRIAEIMKKQGITPKELSDKTGIPIRRLRSYIYGEREPGIGGLIALTDALKCTVDEMIRDGERVEE